MVNIGMATRQDRDDLVNVKNFLHTSPIIVATVTH